MKLCGYCGRQNENNARFCNECGTAFEAEMPPKQRVPRLPLAKLLHELNAWSATAIFLTSIIVEGIIGVVAAIATVLSLHAHGGYSADRFQSKLSAVIDMPLMSVLIVVLKAVAVILAARLLVRAPLRG